LSPERSETPGSPPFRLRVSSDPSKLAEVRLWLGQIAGSTSLGESRTFDLQVAASEAVANAIEHAASAVEIEVWLLPDRILIEISNDGVFQPGLYKDDPNRRRGLGLPPMVSLADQVQVARLPDHKTRVSLTFHLADPSGGKSVDLGARAPTASAANEAGPPLALWFILAAFAVAVAVVAPLRLNGTYNPTGAFTAANVVFLTLVSVFVSVLAARRYLQDGLQSFPFIASGTLALGLGALLAAVHAGGPGSDSVPATYNTASLLAGLCFLGAALWPRRTLRLKLILRTWMLFASNGTVVVLLGAVEGQGTVTKLLADDTDGARHQLAQDGRTYQ
jgi:anti-sigma regulatory factor (Ser/Thr protein kinase)